MALGSLVWRLPGLAAGAIVAAAAQVPPGSLCAALAATMAAVALAAFAVTGLRPAAPARRALAA